MRRLRVRIVLAVAIFGLLGVPGIAPSAVVASPEKPERVLIIVLDQVRQDTLSRYKMTNVRGLMSEGVSFPNAYLGHMAAETVISHNVITSGQFPKNMGWSNEVYRDVGDVLGLGDGAYYVTSSMSCAQFDALITARGYLKLQDYLDARFDDPDTTGSDDSTFAAIAEKRTAACSAGHTTDAALDPGDFIFQIRGSGAGTDVTCDGITSSVWRKPEAVSRPAYIEDPNVCSRWWTRQSTSPPLDYGTTTQAPAWMYPLEGNRFMPGTDPGHTGGDAWSADAAIEVIENDDVFVASTASAVTTTSSSRNILRLASRSSTIASTTSLALTRSPSACTGTMRAAAASASEGSSLPFDASLRSASATCRCAASAAPMRLSNTCTRWPYCAAICAMPVPIAPAPTTATSAVGASAVIGP